VLSGPSEATGPFELTWTFDWPGTSATTDHYELEYSYTSATSGFQVLARYPNGDRTSPFTDTITPDAGDIGKTTAEMQMESTFTSAGWDFVAETVNGPNDIWTIHEGADYPKQVWQLVNFIGWYQVDLLDFAFFADRWADTNCVNANDCDGTDLDFSDTVDWADLKIFCQHWLAGK